MWRTASTTSCDVFPAGLLISSAPSTGGAGRLRGISFSWRSGFFLLFGFAQELVNVPAVFLAAVENEVQLRAAAHAQARAQFAADEARGGRQTGERGGVLFFRAHHAHEDARQLEVRRD